VYVLHGNRDFLLGEAFAERTGVKLLPDPVLLDLYGVPTLLSHGDVFCTEDPAYQALRSIVRKPDWQRRFLSLPLPARRTLASAARAGSKAHTQRTIPTIMDVNPDAVSRAMRATGARRLIHGHTHRPAVHPFVIDGANAERVVLAEGAVQRMADGEVVFVQETPGRFRARPVKAQPLGDGRVAVEGLPAGVVVVTEGAYYVRAALEGVPAEET